jgi:hypothetical protein
MPSAWLARTLPLQDIGVLLGRVAVLSDNSLDHRYVVGRQPF